MSKVYNHWSEYPMDQWRWPDFSPEEMSSSGNGELLIHEPSMDKLQAFRTAVGSPFIVNSAYRTQEYNKRVGGATRSQHLVGKAFDISMSNHNPLEFEAMARNHGFKGIGIYAKHGFIHIDNRDGPNARWAPDGEFPKRENRFAPQPVDRNDKKVAKETAIIGSGAVVFGELVGDLKAIGPMLPDDWKLYLYGAVALIAVGLAVKRLLFSGDKEDM